MIWRLLFWIFVAKALTVVAILYSGIGLMPDEAQYWTWSRALSYCYYSKPAGIAWQIAWGTSLFGNTELGVRFGAVVLSFFLSLAIFYLCKAAGASERGSFWSAVAFAFCPLGIFSGFLATTDCAYVLFWTIISALFLVDSPLLAVAFIIGVQWKWPLFALWIPIFIFAPTRKTFFSFLLSLLGLIPALIWNINNDFVTFRHVATSINPLVESKANPLEFLGAQVALVSPLLFGLLIVALFNKKKDRFCLFTTLAFFGTVLGMSFFEKVQGNWAVAAYPTAFALLALAIDRKESLISWVKAAIGVSVVLITACFYLPRTELPVTKNPFKEGLGWQKIPAAVQSYDPQKDFLFSDRYQMTSILSFYGPEQKKAYFFNTAGLRHNQFCYWPGMPEECVGKTGYFVEVVINEDRHEAKKRFTERLSPFFDEIIPLPSYPLYKSKTAIVLRCEGYNGLAPITPQKY